MTNADDPPFIVGTTSTALGMFGASPGSDWASWEHSRRAALSGDGAGGLTRYGEDAALLAEHGIGHHRVVIDWTTVAPRAGRLDAGALERERERLQVLVDNGVRPWVALHHVALPGWFVDLGGFADDRARGTHWPRFVDEVAQTLGDLVTGWFPILEPTGWAMAGHLHGRRPPGRTDPEAFAKTLRGVWLAWLDAWRQLRGGGAPVATAIDLVPVRASDETIPAGKSARWLDRMIWQVAVSALRDGIIEIPGLATIEVPELRDSADLVGFTYAGAFTVAGDGSTTPYPAGARQPWIDGFADTLRRLAEELPGRPLIVASHGVGTDDDDHRCEVIRTTFDQLRAARHDGIDVRGYFHRCAIDGYEPDTGVRLPWGVFDRDRDGRESAQVLAAAW